MTDYDDSPTNVQGPPPGRPLNKDQKSAIAAALVGTAALGGAAYAMSQLYMDDESSTDVAETDPSKEPAKGQADDLGAGHDKVPFLQASETVHIPAVVQISAVDRHEMTFEDAFRDARHEMGAGHYFEWHGQLYNTYFKDEWDGMSPTQHQDFLASVYGDDMPDGGAGSTGHHATVLASGEIPPAADVSVADNDVRPDESDITIDHHTSVAHEGFVTVDESNTRIAGDVHSLFGQGVDVVLAELDGHEVTVYDVDHDGHPDAILNHESHVVMLDTDHDHILDSQALVDPDTHHISEAREMDQHYTFDNDMNSLHHPDPHTDVQFTSHTDFGNDFNNNADITDFAT